MFWSHRWCTHLECGYCGLITSVVYSPRVWLSWVDDIGGVLTSSVALVSGWHRWCSHLECGCCGLMTSVVYSPRVWLLWVDDIDGVLTSCVAIVGWWHPCCNHLECGYRGLITSVVYSPRVWLLWVDDIGGVLTSSVAIVGWWHRWCTHLECGYCGCYLWLVSGYNSHRIDTCPSLNDIREFMCFKCTRSEQVYYFKLLEFNALWITSIYKVDTCKLLLA